MTNAGLSAMRGLTGWMCLAIAVAASVGERARGVELNVGDIIVADVHHPVILNRGGGDGRIIKVDPATGQQTLIASGGGISDPTAIAIDPAGRILTTDSLDSPGGYGWVVRTDPATGEQIRLSDGGLLRYTRGIAIDPAGNIYVSNFGDQRTGIIRIDPVTGAQTPLSLGGLFQLPGHIAFDSAGKLLVANYSLSGASGVVRVDPVTGAQEPVPSDPLSAPVGIAIEPDGKIIVSQPTINFVRIDPTTGDTKILSPPGLLYQSLGLDIDIHGTLRAVDYGQAIPGGHIPGELVMIDRMTGAQSIVSEGQLFLRPSAITSVVPEPSLAAVLPLAAVAAAALSRRGNRICSRQRQLEHLSFEPRLRAPKFLTLLDFDGAG